MHSSADLIVTLIRFRVKVLWGLIIIIIPNIPIPSLRVCIKYWVAEPPIWNRRLFLQQQLFSVPSCSKQSFKAVNLSFKVLIPNLKVIFFSHKFINSYSKFSPLSLSNDLNTWFSDFKAVHSTSEIHSESAKMCYPAPSSARILTEPGWGVSTLLHPPLSPLRLYCVWKVRHAFNCVIQGVETTFLPITSILLYNFL